MATIADVAKLAGVSAGTVSRVLNGADNVRPDTRARVNQAIAALDFEPNFQARSLRSKRTYAIAMAVPELTNYYWTSVAAGVQDALQAQGYHLILCNTGIPHNNHLDYLSMMLRRVDGIILTRGSERKLISQPTEDENGDHPDGAGRSPAVFIGQSQAANWNVDSVYSDSISGAFALTEHFIRLGHRRIAIVTGRETSSSANDRVAGYVMALTEAGIAVDPRLICWGEYHRTAAYRTTLDLLERAPNVTAIVAANNEISIGVMGALESLGQRVPQDVAVAGFENFYPDSRFASIMTCVDTQPYDQGVNAAQLLLHRLRGDGHLRPRSVVLPTRLIVRESCGGGQAVPFSVAPPIKPLEARLVLPLTERKFIDMLPSVIAYARPERPINQTPLAPMNRSTIEQTRRALKGQPTEARLHWEYAITNRRLFRYVLEQDPLTEARSGMIAPEDQVIFALKTGLSGVICRFPWQHTDGEGGALYISDLPSLSEPLDYCDRWVQAMRNTAIGVAVELGSLHADRPTSERLFDYQCKAAQLVCDRFADELAFALVNVQGGNVPSADLGDRLGRLLQFPLEHGLPVVAYLSGALDALLPIIQAAGVDAVYPADHDLNDFDRLRAAWGGKLSLMGGIPRALLLAKNAPALQAQVRALRSQLAGEGGWIPGVAGIIDDEVPYEGFLMLLRALQSMD